MSAICIYSQAQVCMRCCGDALADLHERHEQVPGYNILLLAIRLHFHAAFFVA